MPGAPLIRLAVAVVLAAAPMRVAGATLVPGGGGRRTNCIMQMSAEGVGFPARKTPKGVSCADGDVCDLDGQRNGVCLFGVSLCLNQPTRACQPRSVKRATVKVKKQSGIDVTSLQAALAAIPLPTSATVCSAVALISVPTRGPGGHGRVRSRKVALKASTSAGSHTDSDTYRLTCVPTTVAGGGGGSTPTTTPVTTTTTTTTSIPIPPAQLGAGLVSQITAATVNAQGVVTITFTLTDTAGFPLIPSTASTDDPTQARVRFTIAHLDVDTATTEGQTTTFTRYRSYIVPNPGQPGYDSGGSLGALDQAHGIYTYTFATMLPPGFPATLTHTVGGQVDRSLGDQTLRANPLFDFVPAGGPVTTVRQVATTAECNGCHQPLAEHGGGRLEVGLCQLCHTDQGFDETGTSIELQQMIHRIHHGNELPSLVNGALGATYEVGGTVFAERVSACAGGALAGVPCSSDGDCPNGTCTGTTVTGVGFPQDIRSCAVCHSQGATAGDHLTKASTSACTGCHDNVNPSEMATGAGAPGANHVAGAQPEAFCSTLCHVASGPEFGLSVPGSHTVPQQSTQLEGLVGELLSASGVPGGSVTVTFRLTNGAGTPLTNVNSTTLSSLALAISGPSTDFGGLTPPVTTPSMLSSSAGTLTGPDASAVFTFTTTPANGIPAGGTGTWRVGMEARRNVTVAGLSGTVQEAMQNVVRDFSVDGSAVVPRRAVVDQAKCASCHGVFSQGFSIHGNLRNRVEYCVVCHNPSNTDSARRAGVNGADPNNQPIGLKHMLHKIHTGENLTQQPYVIYGFNGSVNDFGDVLFPGNRANCEGCHLPETFLLPLPSGVLPTLLTKIGDPTVGSIPPIQDACLSCHDDAATAAHAATNTAPGGAEACAVCHGETGIEPVSTVHANALL